MKIECPDCKKEIEFDLNITLKHKNCAFCELTDSERDFLVCLVIVRGNISEYQEHTGNSRSLIESEFASIEMKLLPGSTLYEGDSKTIFSKLDHETIRDVLSHLPGTSFKTFPDFINKLQELFPELVKRYREESPRNWRARIGRLLGEFSRTTGEVKKAGRARNTQIWEIPERKVNESEHSNLNQTHEGGKDE